MCVDDEVECNGYFMECDGNEDCAQGGCCIEAKWVGPPEATFCGDCTASWMPVACHTDADCAARGEPSQHCVPVGPPYPDTLQWCL
jgi:hypothetical protein